MKKQRTETITLETKREKSYKNTIQKILKKPIQNSIHELTYFDWKRNKIWIETVPNYADKTLTEWEACIFFIIRHSGYHESKLIPEISIVLSEPPE